MFRICTPQLLLLSSLVDAQYLWWSYSNKKTFVAIAWDKMVLSHKVRSIVWFAIPLKTASIVHGRQCQIYLKVLTTRMVIQISFPLFLPNVTFDKKTHHNIRCMDYPVVSVLCNQILDSMALLGGSSDSVLCCSVWTWRLSENVLALEKLDNPFIIY